MTRTLLLYVTDIDECLRNNGGCEEVCTNNIGSYRCGCISDLFRISLEDGKRCIGKSRYKTITKQISGFQSLFMSYMFFDR